MKRYVQHHLSASDTASYPVEQLGFDGFSEVWYDSAGDRARLQAEPDFLSTIVPDEAMFLDLSATRVSMHDRPVVQIG